MKKDSMVIILMNINSFVGDYMKEKSNKSTQTCKRNSLISQPPLCFLKIYIQLEIIMSDKRTGKGLIVRKVSVFFSLIFFIYLIIRKADILIHLDHACVSE